MKWIHKATKPRAALLVVCGRASAAYWTGGVSAARKVREMDIKGAFIECAEPWRPGTCIHMTFEPSPELTPENGESPQFGLWAKIIRSGPDGTAVQFIYRDSAEQKEFAHFLARLSTEEALQHKNGKNGGESGQALIEAALVIPLMILLILNVVNFGAFLHAWIAVANAARSGAQYWAIGGAMVTAPATPSEGQVTALVQNSLAMLPNNASVQVRVCSNNPVRTPRINCVGSGSTTAPPTDISEGSALYVLGTVDVSYTYRPLVPAAFLTMPPSNIKMRSVMRVLQ